MEMDDLASSLQVTSTPAWDSDMLQMVCWKVRDTHGSFSWPLILIVSVSQILVQFIRVQFPSTNKCSSVIPGF